MTPIKGIIFDIDGVLEYQGRVYPGAVETVHRLRQAGFLLRFLTNSTLKSRASCTERLQKAGFTASLEEVITASYATAVYLREQKPKSCWVMLEREGLDEFAEFPRDMVSPEYLVIGDNRSQFDFAHLNQALRILLRGAHLIGMQAELIDSSIGEVELNVGSWVGMLERASGIPAVYIGKPNPFVFDLAVRSMGLQKEQVLVVGDRVATDIRGARMYGTSALLVKTGEFEPKDLDGTVQPDLICESIQDLLEIFHLEEK